jgi:hypothetical protein
MCYSQHCCFTDGTLGQSGVVVLPLCILENKNIKINKQKLWKVIILNYRIYFATRRSLGKVLHMTSEGLGRCFKVTLQRCGGLSYHVKFEQKWGAMVHK